MCSRGGAGDFSPPGLSPVVSAGIQEPSQRWESLMSLSMFLCVPQTAVQRKRWRAPCKLMCPLPPRGFHFAMQPYGRAPPLSNPSPVSASNPGGPHFCVFSFSLSCSVCLFFFFFVPRIFLLLWHSVRVPVELLLFSSHSFCTLKLETLFFNLDRTLSGRAAHRYSNTHPTVIIGFHL